MHSNILPVLTSAATLLGLVQGQSQQPYRDWAKAYEAAEALVLPWTIEQQANISVRDGTAPGFVPFEPSDGEYFQPSCSCTSFQPSTTDAKDFQDRPVSLEGKVSLAGLAARRSPAPGTDL